MSNQSNSIPHGPQPGKSRYSIAELRFLWETRHKIKVEENGCWFWQKTKNRGGYGVVSHNGIFQRAHRVAYRLCVGQIPDGLEVLHNCPGGDNPSCVNPQHLFLGTSSDNVHDCINKGRMRQRSNPAGENNPNAQVTEEIVRAIRQKAANGVALVSLQQEYGLSRASVSRIVNRKAWAHVADVELIETVWGSF